ncbi:hypothetical protein ABPG72_020132 [Tetrahymena utriculariae]
MSIWLSRTKPYGMWIQNKNDQPVKKQEYIGKHGEKLHVWGAISYRGAISLDLFEENLTAENYINILKKKRRLMNQLYPEGYYFQHDNSSIHKSQSVQKYIKRYFSNKVIDWPSYSPDLSPIENIWAWIKQKVSSHSPQTIPELKRLLRQYWKDLNSDFLAPYFDSMPERLKQVISNKGAKINY